MVGNVIVKCELFMTSIFEFLRPQINYEGHCLAAILNFIKTLKKSPAHLHIVGNVIVKCD